MHLAPLIHDLALILTVAGLVTLVFRKIRQPVVLGYIIAGIIVGPYTPPYHLITDIPGIKIWAELGVIFLMFSLGLEFSFRKLTSVGLPAAFTACFEVVSMLSLGFLSGKALGWSGTDSLFLGAMLSISSTTIILKALDELKFKNHKFAELIFAILIVEDLVAILILVGLSNIVIHQGASGLALLSAAYKLFLVVGSWFMTGYFIVPRFMKHVGRTGSNETLTIVSLGLCLALVVFSTYFEYSAALGAFIMGSILAETIESHRIEERMESLRDVFAAVFFVSIGMLIDPSALWHHKGAVALITVVTLVGKTISTTLGALLSGQPLKTSVQVGFGLAQIGEFSFIIAGMGLTLGVTSDFLYPVGVAVSLITTFTTPYMIRISYRMANSLQKRLPDRIKAILDRYVNWSLKQRADATRSKEFYLRIFKWVLNALIVSMIFILSGEFLLPLIQDILPAPWASIAGWFLTLAASAPFIWAMLSLFRKPILVGRRGIFGAIPMLAINLGVQILSLLWLGALSLEFLQMKHVTIIVGVVVLGLMTLFYKRIEPYYHWFERKFISTFEAKEKSTSTQDPLKHLAPWDAHLVRFTVHPNANLAGVILSDAQVRTRFGVSIVALQRGLRTLIAPKRDERIMPGDELLILGTDDQLDAVRPEIEGEPGFEKQFTIVSDYELKQILVSDRSPIVNHTIRTSRIREDYNSIVVGIERQHSRIINPESDTLLLNGDTLWVAGEKQDLDRLTKKT